MNEIKFRAYVESDIIEGRPAEMYRVSQLGWDDNGIDSAQLFSPITQTFHALDAKWFELRQYTGLKDSTKWEQLTKQEQQEWLGSRKTEEEWTGKEIFEGDIVKDHSDGGAVKRVDSSIGCWYAFGKRSDIMLGNVWFDDVLEVIGSDQETPELLKGGTQ